VYQRAVTAADDRDRVRPSVMPAVMVPPSVYR